MANEAAIRDMVASIERDPESWNMGFWGNKQECGTTYCAAGHAILNAGLEVKWIYSGAMVLADESKTISHTARELLGLTWEQGEELFFYTQHCVECDTDAELCEDSYPENDHTYRHPTVDEFKKRVTEVTGVQF